MLQTIDPKSLEENVFSLIGDQWMLITAGTVEHCNTMTASWGGLGILWNRPVATCYIRPQRYTNEFVDRSGGFTLSFLGPEYRQALALCGSKSGREVDKFQACGLTPAAGEVGAPYIAQARLVLVCKSLYLGAIRPEGFLDPTLDGANYPQRDYHKVYIGEVVQALKDC